MFLLALLGWETPIDSGQIEIAGMTRDICCQYLGEHPRNKVHIWTDNLQGVTHDDNYWYFTQTGRLWKVPVERDLASDEIGTTSQVLLTDLALPAGCNHFGDPCAMRDKIGRNTLLFIPVEGCACPMLIAMVSDPERDDPPRLQAISELDQMHAAWCAIDSTGRLFSSNRQITHDLPLNTYSIDSDRLHAGVPYLVREADQHLVTSREGQPVCIDTPQGADFDDRGRLFIVSGYCCGRAAADGGIRVFERKTGNDWTLVLRSDNGSGNFNYEYHPGPTCFRPFDLCLWEEPEGLTFWPLNDGRAPGISGSLHVLMIDHNGALDGMRFKHYQVD
jgi:hypothetical protein